MGPLPGVAGAPAAACPASPRRLCPAPPPLGGAVGEGPRPRPPPTRSGRLHRYILVPTPDGGGPEDPWHRGAQPPSQPHGGQVVLLERGDSHPIQGVLLDQRVYYQGILRVDVPDRKIQHGSTSDPRPVRSPTPAAVARHLGRAWVTSTPDQRREALAGAPEIQPSRVLRYMGTDIYLQGAPTAPTTCRRSGRSSGHSSAPSGSPRTRP